MFFNELIRNPNRLAKFCVTQLLMRKSCDENMEFEGQIQLPVEKSVIVDACNILASASILPLTANGAIILTPANDVFVIEADRFKIVFKAEEGRLKVESSGTNFDELFNRKEILNVIDSLGVQKVNSSLSDVVHNAFEKKQAVIDQSGIINEQGTGKAITR